MVVVLLFFLRKSGLCVHVGARCSVCFDSRLNFDTLGKYQYYEGA